MKRRGRRFLTRCALILTGGVAIALLGGGVYFLFEPGLSLKRVFAVPLLFAMPDLLYRLTHAVGFHETIGFFLKRIRVTRLVFGFAKLVRRMLF